MKMTAIFHTISRCTSAMLLFAGVTALAASAQTTAAQPAAMQQSKTMVLDSQSQVSLTDAYSGACAHGGLLVLGPGYKGAQGATEALPASCEKGTAILDLRRPDFLTGRLNVRNQGAAGDGQKDDTAALQAAIDFALKNPIGPGAQGSPVVYLPAGTYKITRTLRIPAQMHLIGDGPETSTLLLASEAANLITVYGGTCTDWACNGSIQGVGLVGGGKLTTGTLLEVDAANSFHIRDVKMYNHGGRGLQLNYSSERFSSDNLYIYAVRWPIILAGDINESYFWNTQIINPGGTGPSDGPMGYCYNVNCVQGKFPGPGAGSPTLVTPDTHAAIFVDKAVNFSFIGGSVKPLNYLAGIQVFNGNIGTIKNLYFEGMPFDKIGRLNAAVIAGGAAEHTTLTSSLAGGATTVGVTNTAWMPHMVTDPADIDTKKGGYLPYLLMPRDYLSGSQEPSSAVPGLKRGQYEVVNVAGFTGDGKLYIASRGMSGTAPATTSWPAGSILEEFPYGSTGSVTVEDTHINAIQPPGQGYKDNCDQTGVRTCADIILGNIPDGLYVDPNGGPNATPGNHPYAADLTLRNVTMPAGNFPHKGEIATHRFGQIAFDGAFHLPIGPENGEVLDAKNLRMSIWELVDGSYLTVPTYANGRTAEPQVMFPAIGGVYLPASGFFTRNEAQYGQGGYAAGGWMNGRKFANQYCWFDTPAEGQKQSANRICLNGGPSNTAHSGFEYDVLAGSKWVNAFGIQGKSDGTADVSITGNLNVAKTLYVKSIQVTNGTMPSTAAASNAATGAALAGSTTPIGGAALAAGQCASGMARVSGVSGSMTVTASPAGDPGDGFIWQGFVSGANQVAVKVCALKPGTPRALTYNVRVQ